MDGIIPLFKPKGMTSHDCVLQIRKLIGKYKIGHTGTLDPGVEGVLPICIGEATKVIPFLTPLQKVYIADVSLGTSTTTEDSEGEIIAEKQVHHPPTNKEIDNVLQSFLGEITQVPPMYSAVKIKGKKLYEYARNNIEIERPKRKITIYELRRIEEQTRLNNPFRLKITCSKGTYIRTLCVDIGQALGYPAHMAYLQRIETDSITKDETVTFQQIKEAYDEDNLHQLLIPIDRVLAHLDSWQVDEQTKQKVLHGQKLPLPSEMVHKEIFKIKYQNELLAIYKQHENNENEIKPVRVFNMHKV